jgi:tetratricopeptide (TPR) repeat protein
MHRLLLFVTALLWPASLAIGQVVLPPNTGVPVAAPTVPSPGYDTTLATLAAGDYAAAVDMAAAEYRGSVKIGNDRWLDTIATATIFGESLYELGRYRDAVARYEEALALSATQANWLLSVRFPPQAPQPLRRGRVATWGRSERNTQPVSIPETMTIRQQGADPQDVLQRGGVLASPYDRTIRPGEILRTLTIAAYRTGSILGDLGRENPSLDAATRALSRRSAPPNHYSQAWIDVALGVALWSQGKADQAQPLITRGLVVANNLDHQLTAWGLIVLGRIALDADQADRAAKLFEEATYAAADQGDFRALEEAFGLAWAAHRMTGKRGVPPSIGLAAEWARGGPGLVLRSRLLAMQAEALATSGDTRGAANALKGIDGRLLKSDAGNGALGAQVAYAKALTSYAGGDVAGGDADLNRAVAIAQTRSLPLFRTELLVGFLRAGSSAVSDRQADGWFAAWLADPAARDYAVDPLGTFALLSSQREAAFDTWVAVAGRRGNEQILEAAEATMRHRWMAARPLGGRRLSLERFLTADPRTLDAASAARRAAIIAAQPGLADLLTRLAQLRTTLEAAAAAAPDGATIPGDAAEWQEYAAVSGRMHMAMAALGAGREAVPPMFPPRLPSAEIRRRLEPRQALVSFHWTASGLFGALETRDRYVAWQVRQAAGIPGELKLLAKSMHLGDRAAILAERLAAGDWQGSAARMERMLFENSRGVSLADGIDELVIVPDGWLWYFPFELLPVATNQAGGDKRMLKDLCRIRYAPTRSLAVMRFEPRAPGLTGLLLGRMNRGEKGPEAAAAAAAMTAGIDSARCFEVPVSGPPTALVGSLFDSLVIYDEPVAAEMPGAVALLTSVQGRAGMTLADWLMPPPKRPQRIILPGMQTAMGNGLQAVPTRPGHDVFLNATDFLAAGATTVLMTRWRNGGEVTSELVREFMQETSNRSGMTPSAAWQRAVELVTPERPDIANEPRLKPSAEDVFPDSRHPFFWSGFLLVDCGSGVYEEAMPPGVPPPPPLAPAAPAPLVPGPDAPAPPPPGGPMPPAILDPPPPRPEP